MNKYERISAVFPRKFGGTLLPLQIHTKNPKTKTFCKVINLKDKIVKVLVYKTLVVMVLIYDKLLYLRTYKHYIL